MDADAHKARLEAVSSVVGPHIKEALALLIQLQPEDPCVFLAD